LRAKELSLEKEQLALRVNELSLEKEQLALRVNELSLEKEQLDLQILSNLSQLEQQARHICELEQSLNIIYNSISWKLMGPARRIHRALWASKNSNNDA